MSYVLTIFEKKRKRIRVVERIETFEPPDQSTIQEALDRAGDGASFDINRLELEEEDFEYREEFPE